MLVLTRKQGERICIGEGIEVSVSAIRGNRVKLAFSAPADISIKRGEIISGVESSASRLRQAISSPERLDSHASH